MEIQYTYRHAMAVSKLAPAMLARGQGEQEWLAVQPLDAPEIIPAGATRQHARPASYARAGAATMMVNREA